MNRFAETMKNSASCLAWTLLMARSICGAYFLLSVTFISYAVTVRKCLRRIVKTTSR
jgi:hypothetical protein